MACQVVRHGADAGLVPSRRLRAPGLVLPVAVGGVSALASQIAGIATVWDLAEILEEVAEGPARLRAGADEVPGDSGPRGIDGTPLSRNFVARGYHVGGRR